MKQWNFIIRYSKRKVYHKLEMLHHDLSRTSSRNLLWGMHDASYFSVLLWFYSVLLANDWFLEMKQYISLHVLYYGNHIYIYISMRVYTNFYFLLLLLVLYIGCSLTELRIFISILAVPVNSKSLKGKKTVTRHNK